VQLALPRLLALRETIRRPLRERLAVNQTGLGTVLAGTAATPLPADGGWSAVIRVPREPGEEERVLRLLDSGVLVHPGFFFDFPSEAFLVVSLLPEPEAFSEGVQIIAADVKE